MDTQQIKFEVPLEENSQDKPPSCFGGSSFDQIRQGTEQLANKKLYGTWKQSALYLVSTNKGDGTYDLQRTQLDGVSLQSVPCISPEAKQMQPGQSVVVRWTKEGKPYIKGPSVHGIQSLPTTIGPLNIVIQEGMWIQSGAYYWSGFESEYDNQPLSMTTTPTTLTENENFPQSVDPAYPFSSGGDFGEYGVPGPWTVAYGGISGTSAGIYVQLTIPAIGVPVTITGINVGVGGGSSFGYNPPFPPYDPSTRSIIFPVWSEFGYTSPTQYSDISSITVYYTMQSSSATQLLPGTPGSSIGISPRALVMFPSTTNTDEMACYMRPTYVSAGDVTGTTPVSETDTTASTGTVYGFYTQQTPYGSVTVDSTAQTDQFGNYPSFSNGSYVYTLFYNWHDDLNISYQITTSTVSGYSYYTAGATGSDLKQTFIGDGATTLFTANEGPVTGIIAITDLITSTDLTSNGSFTGTDNNITMSSPPLDGHPVQFEFYGTTSVGTQPFTVDGPVTYLGDVYLNGTIVLSSYSGDQVTLSVPTSLGDSVAIGYEWGVTSTVVDTFAATSTSHTVYELSAIPNTGTITVSPIYAPPWGTADYNIIYLSNPKQISIALQYPNNVSFPVTYVTAQYGSILYNATGMTVTELDLTTNSSQDLSYPFATPVSATPPKLFTGALTIPYNPNWSTGWQGQRWGFGMYDPNSSCYTALDQEGIHWRSRHPGATLGVSYTTTPWPDEVTSSDYTFTGYSTPNATVPPLAPGLKRRTAPWLGCSVVVDLLLQGSWGAVGPNWLSTSGNTDFKAFSDIDYPIRFYIRNSSSHIWELSKELSVTKLVFGNEGSNPLYIPGTGLMHRDAQVIDDSIPSFSTGRSSAGQLYIENTWWPWTSDATSAVIGCGWCEKDWGTDTTVNNTQANYIHLPLGATDAGYTLSCCDPQGAIISQLTIKPDPTYSENAFVDVSAQVNYTVAHSADFLPSYGIDTYYTTVSGGPRGGTNSGYTAIPGEYGAWFTVFTCSETDGGPKAPKLQYPGIPNLAENLPRYSSKVSNYDTNGAVYTPYGSIFQEDNFATQRLVGDASDSFYFCLSIPYWVRVMDVGVQTPYVTKSSTFTTTLTYPSGVSGTQALDAIIPGYAVSPYNQVNPVSLGYPDGYTGALMSYIVDNYPSTPYPTLNGAHVGTGYAYTRYEIKSWFPNVNVMFILSHFIRFFKFRNNII